MHTLINSPWQIGALTLPHRLIQGPLAGYSCAPFRELFYQFLPPAFCVSEMISAYDLIHKHTDASRYIYRSAKEHNLAYQIAGNDAGIMAKAAYILEKKAANLIDINCGCPKTKMRKKGAGSALLEEPQKLIALIKQIRQAITIPLTVKIRLQGNEKDLYLAQEIAEAGADALIVHGRRWYDDYTIACDFQKIAQIKQHISIPVIANGDICSRASLEQAFYTSGCDAFMIARAGCGRPWLYQELLEQKNITISRLKKIQLFIEHLQGLAYLENEYKAVLQSRSLVRYYFREQLKIEQLNYFYTLSTLKDIEAFLLSRTDLFY